MYALLSGVWDGQEELKPVLGGAHDMHRQMEHPHRLIAHLIGAMLPVKPAASVSGTCRRAAVLPTRPAKDREEVSTRRPV